MATLRVLCENYIRLDDEVKKLSEAIDNSPNKIERDKRIYEYMGRLVELDDFEAGMRRNIVKRFLERRL